MAPRLSSFLAELKRRKVYHVAVAYVLVAAGILEAASNLLAAGDWERLRLPVVVIVLVCLPIALVLAWAYEVRPEEPREVETGATSVPGPTSAGDRKSIVVLPFDNMSPDPGDAYFADGLTEEIITNLSHIRSLRVISRNSAMVLKGTQKDTRTIGKELDVQYVLEGSVRKADENLRITAQVIDAGKDEHLWSETYHGTMEDVFLIQEQTARSIVNALRLSLSPKEEERLLERPIEDLQAYEFYLMARRELGLATPEGLERMRTYLERGLEMVGENVALLQGLADYHLQVHEYGVKADEDTLQQAEDLANRISALHPDSAHSHYLKGRIQRFQGDFTKAIRHFERALASDPTHPMSLLFLFHSYALQAGRPEYATPMRDQVRAQDPLDFLTLGLLGIHDWMRGDLQEALSGLRRTNDLFGANDLGDMVTAYLLIWLDRRDKALALTEDVVRRETQDTYTEWGRFLRSALEGKGALAPEALGNEARRYLWNDPEFMWLGTSTFALAGQKEEALNWLEHVVERGWINYPLFSEQDPLLESIRGEERFKGLMVRVKRDWEAFGAELESHA